MIKEIKNKKEQEAYKRLAAYCFNDTTGWTELLFPLGKKDDFVLGCISPDDGLQAAAMSIRMQCQFFGMIWKASGISVVVSDPGSRNQGKVREVMVELLRRDRAEGKELSLLYPFLFGFYRHLGYGFLGVVHENRFDPKELSRFKTKPPGTFREIQDLKTYYREIESIINTWSPQFDAGILWPFAEVERMQAVFDKHKSKRFIYYDNDKKPAGYIQFTLHALDHPFATQLNIRKMAWRDIPALHALLHFLWSHRDQCCELLWITPENLAVPLLTKEPPIQQKSSFNWMGRVLSLEKVLKAKAAKTPSPQALRFSVHDEIIEENSGTYTVEDFTVCKQEYQGENPIDLSLLSSLILGGQSAEQAYWAGLVMEPFLQAGSFFGKSNRIFVTEGF